jgi:hypothetical protein
MRLVGSITKVLLSVLLGFYLPVSSVTAALLSQENAEFLSSAYVEATFDDRQMVYQLALSKLQAIQLFDAEMTKVRPAPALNPAHPIWKAARNTVLTKLSLGLERLMTKSELVKAYRTSFLMSLSDSDAEAIMAFISSAEGKSFFYAMRLKNTYEVMQQYALLIATSRADLPEFIPQNTLQGDLRRLSEETKNFPQIGREAIEKIKVFAETEAGKKLRHAATGAALSSLMQLSTGGHLDGIQGLAHTIATQAADEFRKSQGVQGQ